MMILWVLASSNKHFCSGAPDLVLIPPQHPIGQHYSEKTRRWLAPEATTEQRLSSPTANQIYSRALTVHWVCKLISAAQIQAVLAHSCNYFDLSTCLPVPVTLCLFICLSCYKQSYSFYFVPHKTPKTSVTIMQKRGENWKTESPIKRGQLYTQLQKWEMPYLPKTCIFSDTILKLKPEAVLYACREHKGISGSGVKQLCLWSPFMLLVARYFFSKMKSAEHATREVSKSEERNTIRDV